MIRNYPPLTELDAAIMREAEGVNTPRYSHRNGEATPPSETSNYYWYLGDEESDEYCYTLGMVYVSKEAEEIVAWGALGNETHRTSDMRGQWWGPVDPPWDEYKRDGDTANAPRP